MAARLLPAVHGEGAGREREGPAGPGLTGHELQWRSTTGCATRTFVPIQVEPLGDLAMARCPVNLWGQ